MCDFFPANYSYMDANFKVILIHIIVMTVIDPFQRSAPAMRASETEYYSANIAHFWVWKLTWGAVESRGGF